MSTMARGAWCVVLGAAVAASVVVSGFSRTLSAQATDPATAYQNNCANCHDQPTGRTPPKAALRERTPESILATITTRQHVGDGDPGQRGRKARAGGVPVRQAIDDGGGPGGCRAVHRQAAGDRRQYEGAMERLRRRFEQLALSAQAGDDAGRRAEASAEMGVRISRRCAGLRQPGHRLRTRLRRQRLRQRVFARRGDRLHLLVVQGRRRRPRGAEPRSRRLACRALHRRSESQRLRARCEHRAR